MVGRKFQWLLAWMLHKANSAPTLNKDVFYAIKTMLLIRYGARVGSDCQHIVKECNRCDGGTFRCSWKLPESCWNCGGSGVYNEFWTLLSVWHWCGYEFHIPVDKAYVPKWWIATSDGSLIRNRIEGYIDHVAPKYYLADECCYWLLFFYDRKTFWQEFGRRGHTSRKFTPMVVLGTMIFRIKHFSIKRRWQSWMCRRKYLKQIGDDSLPF